MDYKSTDINVLNEELHNGVVEFEYTKKDGSIRTAKGTLNDEYLPEKLPDHIKLNCDAVNTLMKVKNIPSLKEYAQENGIEYLCSQIGEDMKMCYVFTPIKKESKVNEDMMTYYDVEKDAFRSFKKDNFLGIVK